MTQKDFTHLNPGPSEGLTPEEAQGWKDFADTIAQEIVDHFDREFIRLWTIKLGIEDGDP